MDTIVYIDGFNLYYFVKRTRALKWLDLTALADHLLPKNNVVQVRYFTARIIATPKDPTGPQRQQVYLDALKNDPRVQIHYGTFRPREKKGPLLEPASVAGQMGKIQTFEEKGSDVNLAVWAMADAYEGRTNCAVILSNDSDLAEPARLLRARKTTLGVIVSKTGQRYNSIPADFKVPLHVSDLRACQLPNPVMTAKGRQIHKPATWV